MVRSKSRRLMMRAAHAVAAVFVATSLAIGGSLLLPGSAAANHVGNCSESSPNFRFAGYGHADSATVSGVQGRLDSVSLATCGSATDDDRANAVWVGIQVGDTDNLIQLGRAKCEDATSFCNSTNRLFWAFGRDHSVSACQDEQPMAPVAHWIANWSSGTDLMVITRTSTLWNFYRDGTKVDDISTSYQCWSHTGAFRVWQSESWDFGDAMGGELTNKFDIDQAAWLSGGVWRTPGFVSPCWPAADAPGKCQVVTNTQIRLWSEH
jgi:hypothetical protein